MSNSKLVNHTQYSPNCNKPRNKKITKIALHHMAGKLTVERCGAVFASASRQASSNYGIDTDGRVGLYVDEENRSWCTSNRELDNEAVTIEVANDKPSNSGKWHVSDKALAKTIDLCTDICQRNGIKKLNFTGDKTGNLVMHKWYAATTCPGPYLESKFPYIAAEVNKRLGVTETKTTSTVKVKENDVVSIASNARYYNGTFMPTWVKNKKWIVSDVSGDRAVLGKSQDGANNINSAVNTKYLTVVKTTSNTFKVYQVKVTANTLYIRKGPGTNYAKNGSITDKGTYTIIAESAGKGSTKGWGKLKSGKGWISLDYCVKL